MVPVRLKLYNYGRGYLYFTRTSIQLTVRGDLIKLLLLLMLNTFDACDDDGGEFDTYNQADAEEFY